MYKQQNNHQNDEDPDSDPKTEEEYEDEEDEDKPTREDYGILELIGQIMQPLKYIVKFILWAFKLILWIIKNWKLVLCGVVIGFILYQLFLRWVSISRAETAMRNVLNSIPKPETPRISLKGMKGKGKFNSMRKIPATPPSFPPQFRS